MSACARCNHPSAEEYLVVNSEECHWLCKLCKRDLHTFLSRPNRGAIREAFELEYPALYRTLEKTSGLYGVQVDKLWDHHPGKAVAAARKAAWELMRGLGWSYSEIGRAFGRDHATVMSALKGKVA